MSSRGSALSRAVQFFREGNLDEVRVGFQLVKEAVDKRLAEAAKSAKSQAAAAGTSKKRRSKKTSTQANGAEAAAPHQTTIQEHHGTVPV